MRVGHPKRRRIKQRLPGMLTHPDFANRWQAMMEGGNLSGDCLGDLGLRSGADRFKMPPDRRPIIAVHIHLGSFRLVPQGE